MQAIFKGTVVAQSDDVVVVDGEHYFPRSSVNMSLMLSSNHRSRHSQYGDETWYSLLVNGEMLPEAAWAYVKPTEASEPLADRIAFKRGVELKA